MRYLKAVAAAVGLCAAPVWASQTKEQLARPDEQQPVRSEEVVKLTDAQLDDVTAGALINVAALNNLNVAAAVQAAVLTGAVVQAAEVTATQNNPRVVQR